MAPSAMRHASISSAAVVAWCASVWPTMWTMCGFVCICRVTVAARWPRVPYATSGGSSREQISVAYRQRGWNLHPDGGCTGLGTSPSSTIRSRLSDRSGSGIGTADSSASV